MIHRPTAWSSAGTQRSAEALPPLPSENEDAISHWERAMIIDSSDQSGKRAAPQHRLFLDHVAPLRQGAYAAADRLWQGFRRVS